MKLKTLGASARVVVSLFCLTVAAALLSSLLLIQHSTGSDGVFDPAAVKAKYAGSQLVSSMRGSMYEYVTEDESIAIVERWIQAGATREGYEQGVAAVMQEDCTSCHSRTSTMTDAFPELPLTSYEDVKAQSGQGLPTGKLLSQLHTHLFAIGTVVLALGLLLSMAEVFTFLKVLLFLGGFVGLWIDTAGWVLGKQFEWAAWMVMGGGGLMSASIAAMAVVVLLDCWIKVPVIGRRG